MMFVYLNSIISWVFTLYSWFIIIRIVGSWFPSFAFHPIMRFIAFYTDPYLKIFRRWIPPLGGVLDLTPILAFLGLKLLEFLLQRIVMALFSLF